MLQILRSLCCSLAVAAAGQEAVIPPSTQTPAPEFGRYVGSYMVAGKPAPAAFAGFDRFVVEAFHHHTPKGRVIVKNGAPEEAFEFVAGRLYAGRFSFTTARSKSGVSYSFDGEFLVNLQERHVQTQTPILEGTLKMYRSGALRAGAKLLFVIQSH